MNKETKLALREYFFSFITDHKKALIDEVLSKRTRYMTVVLEDLYKSFNANAVMRSADCFGIQDVHIIENQHEYEFNPHVAKGAVKWLDRFRYNEKENNTLDCINKLKKEGYRIVATTPHTDDVLLPEFDINKGKFALVFGTEQFGISDLVRENADEFLRVPMHGFTESYNISVSAALCFYELSNKIHESNVDWKISDEEILDLHLEWSRKIITRSEEYEKYFFENHSKK